MCALFAKNTSLIDVSGGIEGEILGEKDEAKMTKFFENLGSV